MHLFSAKTVAASTPVKLDLFVADNRQDSKLFSMTGMHSQEVVPYSNVRLCKVLPGTALLFQNHPHWHSGEASVQRLQAGTGTTPALACTAIYASTPSVASTLLVMIL